MKKQSIYLRLPLEAQPRNIEVRREDAIRKVLDTVASSDGGKVTGGGHCLVPGLRTVEYEIACKDARVMGEKIKDVLDAIHWPKPCTVALEFDLENDNVKHYRYWDGELTEEKE